MPNPNVPGDNADSGADELETRLTPSTPPSRPSGPTSGSGWLSGPSVGSARFAAGTILAGRYRIIGPIGKGGMGEVYRADDLRLGQPVALKFLPDALATDPARLAQFHHEVRTARQVSHPNVCRVYDIGEVDGLTFLSMEYVDGEDLASLNRRIGRLSPDKALDLARQLCAGLSAAHDRGVLHRDLKPANIMLDGSGQVRITDFGLAGLAGEVGPRAGTPAYMAPEQLAGKEATVQSDIYALGLVLYEVLTGHRPFDFRTIAELIQRHEEGSVPPPSAFVTGLDPAVDRAILRCLARDPAERPLSARMVAAALPGGDPLAAALAAGETPSPAMVAAAGETRAVRAPTAAAATAFVLVGLAALATIYDRTLISSFVPMDRSPEVLEDRAQALVRQLGYEEAPVGNASGLAMTTEALRYLEQKDQSPQRWERLRTGHPVVIFFWYREAPRPLVPVTRNGRVGPNDPPIVGSNMVEVVLDTRGRLIEFIATPPPRDPEGPAPPPPDWKALFDAAGLDLGRFTPAVPIATPKTFADTRAAWEGPLFDDEATRIRVEASSYRGKASTFQILAPWSRLLRQGPAESRQTEQVVNVLAALIIPAFLVVGAIIARRNLRLGRGDRHGAAAAGVFVLVTTIGAWILAASHVPVVEIEIERFFNDAVADALFLAAMTWVWYIAIEPFVRRFWPNALLGWSRLVAGHVRDPRVGLEVLAGAVYGTLMTLLLAAHDVLPPLFGRPAPIPQVIDLDPLLGTRVFLGDLLETAREALRNGMIGVFGLVFFRMLFRRPWLAFAIAMIVFTPVALRGMFPSVPGVLELLFAVLILATVVVTIMRFGLLAGTVGMFFHFILAATPLTWHWSRWYAGAAIGTIVCAAALALFGYYAARGNEPLFGRAFEYETAR